MWELIAACQIQAIQESQQWRIVFTHFHTAWKHPVRHSYKVRLHTRSLTSITVCSGAGWLPVSTMFSKFGQTVSYSEEFTQDGVRLATLKFAWRVTESLFRSFGCVVALHYTLQQQVYFVEVSPAIRWQKSYLNVKINLLVAFQCWSSRSASGAPHVTIYCTTLYWKTNSKSWG